MNWKEGAFIAIATMVAVLLVEPLVEKVINSVSPTTAAKLGIATA